MAGPIISHNELFGFDDYRKGIKDIEVLTKEFGASVDQTIKNINSNIKDMKSFFADTATMLKATNLSTVGAREALQKYNEEIETTRAENEKLKNAGEGMKMMLDSTKASVKELKTEYNRLKKEYEALSPGQADYAHQVEKINAQTKAVLPAIKNYEATLRNQKKYVDVVNDSYYQMQQRLTELNNRLRSMPNAFDAITGKLNKNNSEAVRLSKEVEHLSGALKTADAIMGNHQRNVGNYASGFSPLSNAVNQLTREAPAAAVSMQTFFLAISNNIPALTDAITNLKAANVELVAAGEKPKSVFKALVGSIFSFQTLISVGITLLTLYGSKIVAWVSDLFKGSAALNLLKEKLELVSKVTADGNKSAGEEIAKLKSLYNAATDVTLSMKDRLLAVNALQREYPDYFGKINDEIILNGKAKKTFDDLYDSIIKTARATAALGELGKLETQRLEVEGRKVKINTATYNEATRAKDRYLSGGGFGTGGGGGAGQTAADQRAVIEERRVKALKEQDKLLDNINAKEKFLIDFVGKGNLIKPAGGNAQKDEKDAKKEDKDAADALKKLRDRISKQQDLLKAAADLEIKENELKLAKGLLTEFEFQGRKLDIIRSYVKAAIDLENKLGKNADPKKLQDFQKEVTAGELEFTKFMQAQHAERSKLAKQSITDVTDANKEAKKKEQELEDALTKKFAEGEKARLDATLDRIRKEYALEEAHRGKSFALEIKYLDKIIDAKRRAGEDSAKEQEQRAVKLANREHEIQLGLQQLLRDSIASGLQIIQENFDASYQNRISRLEEEKNYELNLAGTNAVARANIEREYSKKIAKEKEKQAKADKAFALFGVAINTAASVAKTIAEWGMPFAIPFIAIAVAQGLIQAAVIAARPIPKYEKGTSSARKGRAIINEKGWELIERKGRMFIENTKGPTVVEMQGGEKVHSHEASKRIVAQAIKHAESQQTINGTTAASRLASDIRKGKTNETIQIMARAMQQGSGLSEAAMERVMNSTIAKMPQHQLIMDERGMRKREIELNDRKTYLNNRYSHN